MTSLTISSEECASVVLKLVSFGTVIASTELLSLRREWSEQGLYCWQVTRTRFPTALRNRGIVILDALCGYRQYMGFVTLQLICGLLLLSGIFPEYKLFLLSSILFAHLLTMVQQHGTDGADQMQTILLICLVLFYATPDPIVKKAAIWFIGAQIVLAYVTAGIVKIWSPDWLSGSALRKSLVVGLGSERIYRWLPSNRWLNQLLCLFVVVYECIFPVVLFLGAGARIAFLAMGVLLHVINAFAFGMPRFVFTFAAAYPAVFCLCNDVQSMLGMAS